MSAERHFQLVPARARRTIPPRLRHQTRLITEETQRKTGFLKLFWDSSHAQKQPKNLFNKVCECQSLVPWFTWLCYQTKSILTRNLRPKRRKFAPTKNSQIEGQKLAMIHPPHTRYPISNRGYFFKTQGIHCFSTNCLHLPFNLRFTSQFVFVFTFSGFNLNSKRFGSQLLTHLHCKQVKFLWHRKRNIHNQKWFCKALTARLTYINLF